MSLYENMLTEPISQLNLRQAITVPAELSVRDAIVRMRKEKLGCVIAVKPDQKPLGMFTEAMLRRMMIEDRDALEDSIADHLADRFPCVESNEPIVTVLQAMQAENHRFVCVIDDERRVIGLTGQKGLMEYIADHFPHLVMTQRTGLQSPHSDREGA